MRTTLDIDDSLMEALQARMPEVSKTEAIETAIESFIGADARNELRAMAGSVQIEDLSRELRGLDRMT